MTAIDQNKQIVERDWINLYDSIEPLTEPLIKNRKKLMLKAYKEANKDKIKAYSKAYREANKDKIKAYNKAYYKKKKWYEKHSRIQGGMMNVKM